MKRIPVNYTFADVNALSKREAAEGKMTTAEWCKNTVNGPAFDLAGKEFDVDVVEISVRRQKMDIPGLFSTSNGNMLCSLGQHTSVDALPAKVRILSNKASGDDRMWLICEAA